MIPEPKGIKYWKRDKNGKSIIAEDAPEWAKKEFKEYQEMMNPVADKDGVIKQP